MSDNIWIDLLKTVKYDPTLNMVINAPPPSLEYLCLYKIATCLWHKQIRLNLTLNLKSKSLIIDKYVYGREIKRWVSQLKITQSCKNMLESVVDSVGEDVTHYFCHLVKFHEFVSLDKARIYVDNLCFNQQGTVNIIKIARKIIDETDLSLADKYVLASNCCLEDKIRELIAVLPENIVKDFQDDSQLFSLPIFFLSYIREKKLQPLIKGIPSRQYLGKFMLRLRNQIAVQYIFENFATYNWKKGLPYIVNYVGRIDWDYGSNILYFCMKMSQTQLEKVSEDAMMNLLLKLKDITEWYKTFSLSKFACASIKARTNVDKYFRLMQNCWLRNLICVEDYVYVWKEFIIRFKIDNKQISNFFYKVFESIDNTKKQFFTGKLLVCNSTPDEKRELVNGLISTQYCLNLVQHNEGKDFDTFVNTFVEPNHKSDYIKKFFKLRAIDLCVINFNLNYGKEFDFDDIFSKYCGKDFKENLFNKHDSVILVLILRNAIQKEDFLFTIDRYVDWRFDYDVEEDLKFIDVVYNLDSDSYLKRMFFDRLKYTLAFKKWESVVEYFRWIFSATEEHITTPSLQWGRIKRILILTLEAKSFREYMKTKACHVLIRLFITRCFNQDEVEELKEEINNGDLLLMVKEMLQMGKLSEISEFLDWSFNFDKIKINKFKFIFLNSNECFLLLSEVLRRSTNTHEIKVLHKWFNTTIKFAKALKSILINIIERNITQIDDDACYDIMSYLQKRTRDGVNNTTELRNYFRKRTILEGDIIRSGKRPKLSTEQLI